MRTSKQYVSIGQASKLLCVCVATVRAWVDMGLLKAYVTPTKHRKISIKDIERITKSK